jgi:hypothetical protein
LKAAVERVIDPGGAGYARQIEIARKMLAGEIDPHLEPNDFSGRRWPSNYYGAAPVRFVPELCAWP